MEWEDFLPHVLPSVKGCPDQIAVDAIVRAARTFCRKTHVWNYECDPILSTAGLGRYVFQLGEGQELVKIASVEVAEREYTVLQASDARRKLRQRCSEDIAYIEGPQDLLLSPAPSQDGQQIIADVVVMPTLERSEWPDDLAQYVEDIAHGAVALLKLEGTGEDWEDLEGAGVRQSQFNDRINSVGWHVSRGMGGAKTRAQIREL